MRRPGGDRPRADRARRHAAASRGSAATRLVAVSMAVAHAAAAAAGKPLWAYLAGDGERRRLPLPEIQIFGGGAHAGRRVDIQDFMVMCPAAPDFAQALERTAEVYRAAGELLAERRPPHGRRRRRRLVAGLLDQRGGARLSGPRDRTRRLHAGDEVAIALDVAASEFGTRRPLPARPGTARARHRRPRRDAAAAGSSATRSSRSRTRSPRTTTRASRASPPRSATACRSSATTFW